ncbi:hypothetical protein MKW92_019973 [Papaver armeniacum]|nr:hypothetical protein MKW92_019973 [Papaver armeniacum]
MSELDAQIPSAFDPFADANADDSSVGTKEYVHMRIQQTNGRKSLTCARIEKGVCLQKDSQRPQQGILLQWTVVQDPELGQVIQLQGDQRKNVSTFLVSLILVIFMIWDCEEESIKIHGF